MLTKVMLIKQMYSNYWKYVFSDQKSLKIIINTKKDTCASLSGYLTVFDLVTVNLLSPDQKLWMLSLFLIKGSSSCKIVP